MTNHSETTGPFENTAYGTPAPLGTDTHRVVLRTPGELADALPYLLGYRPEDSMVLAAVQDPEGAGRFGARVRLGIPENPDDWASAARELARGLIDGARRRGVGPDQMVVYVCQEPGRGKTARDVMERLRPLVHHLRLACGRLEVPVVEALCVSGGRFWSYCCASDDCCPAEGTPMALPGTSVLAAAAAYAGVKVRGTLRELRLRLMPLENSAVQEQERALDAASWVLVPRIVRPEGRAEVADETIALAERLTHRLAAAPPVPGPLLSDRGDDELITADEAARVILGLQDRETRDRAAAWMEGDEAAPALRLWRALARRCVPAYCEFAAAPLTLAGWVAWSGGDRLEAREAFAMALAADADYLFAALLHRACNEGLDPESVRRSLRRTREQWGEREGGAAGRVGVDGVTGADGVTGIDGVVGGSGGAVGGGVSGAGACGGGGVAGGRPAGGGSGGESADGNAGRGEGDSGGGSVGLTEEAPGDDESAEEQAPELRRRRRPRIPRIKGPASAPSAATRRPMSPRARAGTRPPLKDVAGGRGAVRGGVRPEGAAVAGEGEEAETG